MKEIDIVFEPYEGSVQSVVDMGNNGEVYLLKMENTLHDNCIEIKMMEVCNIRNGKLGFIGGHFSYDYKFMNVVGVCKLNFK